MSPVVSAVIYATTPRETVVKNTSNVLKYKVLHNKYSLVRILCINVKNYSFLGKIMSEIHPLNKIEAHSPLVQEATCNPSKELPLAAAIIKTFGEIQDHLDTLPFDHEIKKEIASLIPNYDFQSLSFDSETPEEILSNLLALKNVLKDPKTNIKSDFFKKLNLQF